MRTMIAGLLFLATASPTLAQPATWSNAEMCVAGGMTYFFLNSAPTVNELESGWVRLRSASGNSYDCRIDGDTVAFRWINKSNEDMTSKSTKWSLKGDRLTVVSDMMTQRFEKTGGTIIALD